MTSDSTPTSTPTSPADALPPAGDSRCSPARRLLGFAALALLATLVYLPSFRGGFVWDDLLLVNENPLVTGKFTLRTIWFATDFPLSNIALWLEWLAFGKNATGYRIVNVILHVLSCGLLWRLLARLRIPGAWLAAILFAVHPVAVGSVAWISEIKNTLSLPFYLLSLDFFLRAEERREAGPARAGWLSYGASLLAFLLALLVKTSTVMLPVVLLACAWWQRGALKKTDVWLTLPHFALALTFGLLTIWFHTKQVLAGYVLPDESLVTKLAVAGMAAWFYLAKALLPLHLSAIYPRWEIQTTSIVAYLPAIALVGTMVVGWAFRRSWGRHLGFGFGVFLAGLFPILGLFDMYFLAMSRVSDHFQYLALIVPVSLVAAGIARLQPGAVRIALGVALTATLAWLAGGRARVFATDESLWRDTLAKNPAAWTAHNNLGCILAEKGDFTTATGHFAESLKLNPRNASAHVNYAKVLLLKNSFPQAEEHFRASLQLKPGQVEALTGLGQALAAQGKTAEAAERLREALQIKPGNELRLQLAPLLSALGRDAEAVAELRAVLQTDANSHAALQNLAWILATSADAQVRSGAEAVQLAERACELTGHKEARMLSALAAARAEAGQFAEAVVAARQASELAQAAGDFAFAQVNAQLLRLYQAGKPYRAGSR